MQSALLVALVPFLPVSLISFSDYRHSLKAIEEEICATNRHVARLVVGSLDAMLNHARVGILLAASGAEPVLPRPQDVFRWEEVDRDGIIRSSQLDPGRVGSWAEYEEFLTELTDAPEAQLSGVRSWIPGSPPTALIGAGLGPGRGRLVGVLQTDILHDELSSRWGEELDRHTYVVDQDGSLVFYSNMELARSGQDLRANPPIRMALAGQEGPIRFRSIVSGKERLGHVLNVPRIGWSVVVSADLGSSLVSVRSRFLMLTLSIVFALAMALAIVVWTNRRLVRPLLAIRDSLRDQARDHPLVLPTGPVAEYAELTCAWNNLTTRIIAAEQELIQATRASLLGQLSSGIAHQLGTPLNVIKGSAQYMMRKMPAEDPGRAGLQMIVRQSECITEMIRTLLDFSRPSQAEMMSVDLHELVLQTLNMLSGLTEKIAVAVDCDPDTPPVQGDPKLLEHAILNLMVNACQAMPDGGRLSVILGLNADLHAEGEDGPWVCCRVVDTGVGIPPENLEKIFQPFFTTKAHGQGTGLGLAIVDRIVRQHRGKIEIRSRAGRGTEVAMRLRTADRSGRGVDGNA